MATDLQIARGWDAAYLANAEGQLWNEGPLPIVDGVLARATARNLRTCLDIGCGDGRNILGLQAGGLDVTGLDISPTALTRADRLLRDRGKPVTLLVGDIRALPVAAGTLDLVTALDVAACVPDLSVVLDQAHRALRPGGMFTTNLFSLEDDCFGEGEEVGHNAFMYRDTLFRFYEREDVEELFADGWDYEIEVLSWDDPPHGTFRPFEHTHVSFVVYATPA